MVTLQYTTLGKLPLTAKEDATFNQAALEAIAFAADNDADVELTLADGRSFDIEAAKLLACVVPSQQ